MSAELNKTHGAFSTQTFLVVLVASLLIPVLIFATVLLNSIADSERSRLKADALDIARQIATQVDRELSGLESALQVATTYRSIDDRDFATLHRQVTQVKGILGADVVVKDATGQQVVNSRLPLGAPLPVSLPVGDRRALETKKPYVSDLFIGATAGRPIVSINAPILRSGEAAGLINIAIETERLAKVLRSRVLPDGWIAALIDRSGKIIARTRQHDQFVGTTATPDLLANTAGSEGTWVGTTIEGTPAFSAYARSALSDWRIAVGAPVATVEAPLRQSLRWLIAFGAGALAISALVSAWCGRQIARSLYSLAEAATALATGKSVSPAPTRLREVNAIGAALGQTAQDLQRRTEDRDRADRALRDSELRLRLAIGAGRMAIWQSDGSSVSNSPELNQLLGFASDANPSIDEIRARYAPGERERLYGAVAAALGRGEHFAEDELEIIWPDGSRHWLLLRADIEMPKPQLIRAIGVAMDITERKRSELHLRLLVNELNHRVKNTLATVQSLAAQSFRGNAAAAPGKAAFEERLMALSRVHDVLTQENWEGARLKKIVDGAISPYDAARFEIDGPDVWLHPRTALALAMAFQELATNASKYGALSTDQGRVSVDWSVESADGCWLRLTWEEVGGPSVQEPKRRGFGTRLIERSLARDLGGEVHIGFRPTGVVCTIATPLPDDSGSPLAVGNNPDGIIFG